MKIEFTSLESEPLLYFLLHSGVFVVGLGCVFFLLGIFFGAVTWGRYKRQCRFLRNEGEGLREEIAVLKRKLAEQVVRPSNGYPQQPPAALLTEVLPKISEIFPERAVLTPAPTAVPPPVISTPVSKVEDATPIPFLPDLPDSFLSDEEFNEAPAFVPKPRVKARSIALSQPPPPRLDRGEESETTPFSFLIQDDYISQPTFDKAEAASLSEMAASLSDIIASTAKTPEISPPPSVIPEHDGALGLVFKERPVDVDDLTRLHGISPPIQNRLQELGIYRLQQIAAWNHSQVREFSRRLAFKDRIERERWVDQARRLMMGEPI